MLFIYFLFQVNYEHTGKYELYVNSPVFGNYTLTCYIIVENDDLLTVVIICCSVMFLIITLLLLVCFGSERSIKKYRDHGKNKPTQKQSKNYCRTF